MVAKWQAILKVHFVSKRTKRKADGHTGSPKNMPLINGLFPIAGKVIKPKLNANI